MIILGLDVGDKRIGMAISDENEIMSTPLKVITNDKNSGEEIKKNINKYNIKKIIIGIPYTLKGEVGAQAKKVIDFTNSVVKNLGVEIDYIDERYTTKIPSRYLNKYSRSKELDKFSASIILGDYLERKRKKTEDVNK